MIVYSIFDAEMGSTYYARLRDARAAKRAWYGDGDLIEKLTLVDLPPRDLAVRLLNGEKFVSKRETVR
jgi:hypothetical protein